MRILVTNDDGIEAHGLHRLAKAALKYGEVWVVAPESNCTAASHSITLTKPIDTFVYDFPIAGVKAHLVKGTPADCVRVAVCGLMDEKPDVVLSGINWGYNAGTDTMYSATLGAAFEANFQGLRAIAFSEGIKSSGEATDAYLEQILEDVIYTPYTFGKLLNVNFPGCKADEVKGILRGRVVSETFIFNDEYIGEPIPGGVRFTINGIFGDRAEEGSDLRALFDDYISIGYINNLGVWG